MVCVRCGGKVWVLIEGWNFQHKSLVIHVRDWIFRFRRKLYESGFSNKTVQEFENKSTWRINNNKVIADFVFMRDWNLLEILLGFRINLSQNNGFPLNLCRGGPSGIIEVGFL